MPTDHSNLATRPNNLRVFQMQTDHPQDLSSSCRIEYLALGTLFRFDCLWGAWNTTTCPEPQHLGQLRFWRVGRVKIVVDFYLYICLYLCTCNMSWGNERCKIHHLVCANWNVYKWNTASLLMGFTVTVEVFFPHGPSFPTACCLSRLGGFKHHAQGFKWIFIATIFIAIIASMWLVYLPTFTININQNVGK